MKPSSDPKADELRNSNLNHPDETAGQVTNTPYPDDGSDPMGVTDTEQTQTGSLSPDTPISEIPNNHPYG